MLYNKKLFIHIASTTDTIGGKIIIKKLSPENWCAEQKHLIYSAKI